MEITGLGWCGTRTGRCSELAHFYEHVLGLRLVHTEAEFWVFELPDGRHAKISGSSYPGNEHFATGPVAGFAVRSRRPLGGDPGNEKPSTRWVRGRPAARNRLPERVSGFKWNLRGTGTRHAAAIFQFFTPGVISAWSASFTCK
jgi:catechol 2,3-dioxygenase-like lactoylglutathione lyase family enzyme